MSFENYCWWHLILTCRGQWLPGDPRGFRSREHRVHSSGDYKSRPPQGEHAGLHAYQQVRSNEPVEVPQESRPVLGEAIINKCVATEAPCLVIATGRAHTHLLAAMFNDWQHVKKQVGRLKQAGSHAIREALPGRVWGDGGKPIRVTDQAHQKNVFRYISEHAQQEGAWVWRYDGEGSAIDPGLRCAQARLLEKFLQSKS
ncbi:MAG: hypothetical protein AAGI37_03185 [Planctomycetota bacterium]